MLLLSLFFVTTPLCDIPGIEFSAYLKDIEKINIKIGILLII
jgi:hypothetical protein